MLWMTPRFPPDRGYFVIPFSHPGRVRPDVRSSERLFAAVPIGNGRNRAAKPLTSERVRRPHRPEFTLQQRPDL